MRIFRVFAPFGNAIDLTIRKLFKPFNLAFYLKLAFIAWLANLGQCSGGFNFPIDGNDLKTFLNSFRQEQPSFQNDPVLKTADGNATYEKVTFEDKKETERISVKVEEGKTADVNFLDSAFHRRNPSLPVYPGSLHCSPLGHFPRTDDVHQRTGG